MFDLLKILVRLKKSLTTKEKYLLLGLLALFLSTRLLNLKMLPIFVDEGGYIFWAKQALLHGQYYLSVLDGKPPLNVWGIALFLKIFPSDPLLAGRLFSVVTGLIGVGGFFILCYILFNKKAAHLGTSLFILTPFILFYDRLAVVDSMVNAVFIWMFIFSILLVKNRSFINSISLGIVMGIGLLTKGNVWLFILVFTLSPLFVYGSNIKKNLKLTTDFLIAYAISLGLALLMSFMVLSPVPEAKQLMSQKNRDFLYSTQELIKNPIKLLTKNVIPRIVMLLHMTGWIAALLAVLGLIKITFQNKFKGFYYGIWLFGTLLLITFSVKHFFPRYLIFSATLIILLTSYFIESIKNKKISYIFLTVLIGIFVYFDAPILFDYNKIDFPKKERVQYVEDISAGYGVSEIVDFAANKSKDKPVILLSEGIFGIGSNMIDAATGLDIKNVISVGSWPLTKEILVNYQQHLPDKYVFVVLNFRNPKKIPRDWPLKHLESFEKAYEYPYFSLYELIK